MTIGFYDMEDIRDCSRESVFKRMEQLVCEMQHPETGVPLRRQKVFLTTIPSAFLAYDLVEWLMDRLNIEETEAVHLANQLCQHGYFFPVSDSRSLAIKDDGSLYRFQAPYFWPSHHQPDNTDYAIYLLKRSMKNKQKHGLEEYEQEALARLKKLLCHKWDFITLQAEEQVNLSKERKKGDKLILDSQEKSYWRVHRPPPGTPSCLEKTPLASRKVKKKTLEDLRREKALLLKSLNKPRVKPSQIVESLLNHCQEYIEFDSFIVGVLPSNPWISEDPTLWTLNNREVLVPTEQRVKLWAISLEDLLNDPTGIKEFERYLQTEYSHENILFWKAVQSLRRGGKTDIEKKVQAIYNEFLCPNAPCEVNLDSSTIESVQEAMKKPTRYTFDSALLHVYSLMEKDTYPRFLRSEHYRNLLLNSLHPSHKKKFFNFGAGVRKKMVSATGAKRRNNPSHLSGSSVDLTHMSHSLEMEEPSMSSRHSHSTSDLHDLGIPGENLASSRLSSPSSSRDNVPEDNPNTLQVPRLSPGGGDTETSVSVSLTVPCRPTSVVAPWETEG
ncbi:regulator of G-protein signaling 7 isoform X2 [Parasteatoda tepidariorum]|uniref:regulator of G-protein signaling 7 isoform X2 n=2 Tax=Parasteatoda tepidariorum TaxID=114398 RepID=UPI00077FAB79|nr:regulator of G-protein signaling 7 isoform X2 [Parasteatoda tepidariorum]